MNEIIERRYCIDCLEPLVYYPESEAYHCSACHENFSIEATLNEIEFERTKGTLDKFLRGKNE